MSEQPRSRETVSGGPGASVSSPRGGRVFGDTEITRILKTAADLQERSEAVAGKSGPGLTLDELRQVAREAGIDPRFVDIAATQGSGPVAQRSSALLGGPQTWRFHTEVPGELEEEDRAKLVRAVRSVMNEEGEVAEVYGRLEWRHDDTLGPVTVGLSSKSGTIEIDVSASRRGEAGLYFGLGVPLGGLAGGAAIAGMIGVAGTSAALAVVAGMAGVSYGLVRLGWRLRSHWWERHLQRRMDQLSSTVQDVVQAAPGRLDEP